MSKHVCEHCRGEGAQQGWFSDEHIDLIECIEALRDQISELRQEVAALREGKAFLEPRQPIEALDLAA